MKKRSLANIKKNMVLLFMVLPGALWFIVLRYIPMFGSVVAFQDYRYHRGGFLASVLNSKWVGLKNFEFLFRTEDAFVMTRNTILYNLLWIFLGLVFSVGFAIALNEITSTKLAKIYQTGMFLPFFLAWTIVSYFVYTFLSVDQGVFNQILGALGKEPIDWYTDTKPWPVILTFMNLWKGTGYGSVVYLAAICGIDKSYYDAAMIDGAGKWQQIRNVTLPAITPLMITLTLLAIGRIFYSDFGLFYNVPRNSGPLYSVTTVIDTYVYRSLRTMGDIGMSSATGLYQSVVGFILVMVSNAVVKKIDSENGLF